MYCVAQYKMTALSTNRILAKAKHHFPKFVPHSALDMQGVAPEAKNGMVQSYYESILFRIARARERPMCLWLWCSCTFVFFCCDSQYIWHVHRIFRINNLYGRSNVTNRSPSNLPNQCSTPELPWKAPKSSRQLLAASGCFPEAPSKCQEAQPGVRNRDF